MISFRTLAVISLLACAGLIARSAGAGQSINVHVTRRVTLGGEGGWDYVVADSAKGRLFITRGSHVMVVEAASGRVLGDIPDTLGVHGVALVPSHNRGFTTNGRDASVTLFDLTSLATVRRVPISASNPDAILYDSVSSRVFTFNGGSASATAIDSGTGDVLGSVPLDGRPEAGVADGRGNIYVNIENKSEMTSFDARTLRVAHAWPIASCEEPTGLAMDPATRRLFVGCGNKTLAIVDADSGRGLATLPIGEGVDGVAFDPSTRLIFASAGEGTLTVAKEKDADAFSIVANVPTQRGARTLALDAARREVYLVTAEFGPQPTGTPAGPHLRPPILPGTFTLLVVSY